MPSETFKSTDLPWRVVSSPVQEGGEAYLGRRYTGNPPFETTKLSTGDYALKSSDDGSDIYLVTNVLPDTQEDGEYSVEAEITGLRIKYNAVLTAHREKVKRGVAHKDSPDPKDSKLTIEKAE